MKDSKTKKDSESKTAKTSKKKDYSGLMIIVMLISITIIFGFIMQDQYNKNWAIEQCLKIQEHPDLNYPCICYPSEKPTDLDPFVDKRTDEFCQCTCDIGNNQTFTADIIITKD